MIEESKTIDLASLAEDWAEKLKFCEYAGEIVIPEAELPVIAKQVHRELFLPSTTTRKCLLVLAVNCMYYEHNEEGFWVHFCNLLDIEDNHQSQAWLGEMLETELLQQKLLAQARQGPFRFVSPLREQSGITRREIPRFASFLNYLTERYGWDGIFVLEREEFNQIAALHVSGRYLSQFLRDDQGWSFTRDVVRSVSQFQRSILDLHSLEQLPGYRTGFFNDLFDALLQKPAQTLEKVRRPPLPRLIFLPDFKQVGLVFEQQSVNLGAYKLNGDKVGQNLIPLDSKDMFEERICGERLNSEGNWEPWSIQGWIPSESPIGLFHFDRGYSNHREGVAPGKYYMIASYKNPPPKEIQLNSYGMVDLPFNDLDYDAWMVLIDQSTNLEFLGIFQKQSDRITDLISWAETANRLKGAYDLEKAFIGNLPPIILSQPELFLSNAVGIFIDDGLEVRRVKPVDITSDRVHITFPINTRGCVWVEPISRMRKFTGLERLGELYFCLLPECRITWPDRLYSFGDQPVVTLDPKDNDISLEIEEAEPINNDELEWRVMADVRLVQGYLKSENLKIPLAHPIFRADIHKRSEWQTPFLVSSDFQNPESLIASGIPRAKAELMITDGRETRALGELGIFNEAGEISFSTFAIRDALAGYHFPVGQFVVMDGSLEVRAETLFINCDAVWDWITDPTSSKDVQWWALLPSSIAEMFTGALQIRAGPLKQVIMPEKTESIPLGLVRMFESLRRLSFVFDGTEFPDQPHTTLDQIMLECQTENKEQGATVSWFVRAKKILDAEKIDENIDAETLLAEYSALSWQPPFQRWKDKIKLFVENLKDNLEALPLIEEWKKDVERSYREPYLSRIASLPGGRDLTHAWVMYRAGSLSSAVIKALNLLAKGVSSPITDLASILVRICWIRLGHFKSQTEIDFKSSNKKLSTAYNELLSIIGFADWTNNNPIPTIENLNKMAVAFPITTQDQNVLKLFAESKHDWPLGSEKDWLVCYFELVMARAINMKEKAKKIAQLFRGIIKDVPASPDKNLLIELTEKYR